MCTALKLCDRHQLFGRNLDIDCSYNENVIITPRKYCFKFSSGNLVEEHYSIIGIGCVIDNYPLYYDATNEHGLSVAALKYDDACYFNKSLTLNDISSYEFIGYILSMFKNIDEVVDFVSNVNITNIAFSQSLQPTPLHWIVSDDSKSVTIESISSGITCAENPVNVLTNMPDFKSQLYNLNSYTIDDKKTSVTYFNHDIIPGDSSSQSRFVRAAINLTTSETQTNDINGEINRFFKILDSVQRIYSGDKSKEYTLYSSCCDTNGMIYYYKTYTNSRITAVRMTKEYNDISNLVKFPLNYTQDIFYENP